jgi:hypothetical protein
MYAYVTSSAKKPYFSFRELNHTIFAILNTNGKMDAFVEVVCPFGNDYGSAVIKEVSGTLMLVDCSKGSSAGAESQLSWFNRELHVIDFSNFSERLVWRKTTKNQDGVITVLDTIDNTKDLPTEWGKYFQ